MKAIVLAAAALTVTAGIANAQFEGTFGSNGNFGFNGSTGFSNCLSGGQGEAGTGATNCSSGATGSYNFHSSETVNGGFWQQNGTESQSQTSTSSGLSSQWQKEMTSNGVTKVGANFVGNVTNTNTLTNSFSNTRIDGTIHQNTTTNFGGSGFTFTNSTFSGGMMGGGMMGGCMGTMHANGNCD